MSLRPYQTEFIENCLFDLMEFDKVLGVAATGAGKTVMAGEIIRRSLRSGPCLFLADAQQLVQQAADKLMTWTGTIPQVEMAESKALPGDKIVVATTQSIARRLAKWPEDYFKLIIIDEAHRNTMGAQAQKVLDHFSSAKVIGITATPFRSDKKELGSYYEKISADVGLMRLIKEGYLSKIKIKTVPLGVDLSKIRTVAGDFRDDDLGDAIAPHLLDCAAIIKEHAVNRRTCVFLPLIKVSQAFVEACNSIGLRAVHVDGKDRSGLEQFESGEADIISNASLLTTGWDEPSLDCVMILRPTQSFTLYSQMVGRGTRIHPGKKDLLLLDPLWISATQSLVKPARLVAPTPEALEIANQLTADGQERDLEELEQQAEERAAADRLKSFKEAAEKSRKKKSGKEVDAMEFALSLGDDELADYEPTFNWEKRKPTEKQTALLKKNGFDLESVTCCGHANKIIDVIMARRELGLATVKQVRFLQRLKHPSPNTATFEEATHFINSKTGLRKHRRAA